MNGSTLSIREEIISMGKDIEFLKGEIIEIKEFVKAHAEDERKWWQESMQTKAGKWTEYVLVTWILAIVGAAAWLVWQVTTKNLI